MSQTRKGLTEDHQVLDSNYAGDRERILSGIHGKLYSIYAHHRRLVLFYLFATAKLYRPSHLKTLLSDLADRRAKTFGNSVHCEAAVKWIFNAQDITATDGISAGYSFSWGWRWPYPETSGYIIPTLFDFAERFPNSPIARECCSRALRIANWLVKIQLPNGAYCCGLFPTGYGSLADKASSFEKPTAFETGQILRGLSRVYKKTEEQRYLESALKAGDWLLENQSPDGSWSVSHQNLPRSFDSFIAWPLAILWQLSGKESYQKSARKNLEWCLSQQMDNGWFDNCNHTSGDLPWTHGMGYAMQGLLETGILLENDKYIEAAQKTAEVLLKIYSVKGFKSIYKQQKGFLPARFNEEWMSNDKFSCLTGNAQISLVWSKLYLITGDIRYLNGALKMNEDLKTLQNLTCSNNGIRGGVKGSHPIYGLYMSFQYPNWAAKFFIDALIAEEKAVDKLKAS